MKNFLIGLGVLVVFGFMLFGWYKDGYNQAIALEEQVHESWAQVENQMQRRFDLVPNLVSTVKGYAKHEAQIFTDITKLRSQWAGASSLPDKVKTANQLSGMLTRLIAVSENYPDLKANQNFLELQAQLEGAENRISVERMRYNQAVQALNSFRRSFFGRFFCSQAEVTEPVVYFKADERASILPPVSF